MSDIFLKFLFHFEGKVPSEYTGDHQLTWKFHSIGGCITQSTPPHTHTHTFIFHWKISDLINFAIHLK
jgi:hypothetical protein